MVFRMKIFLAVCFVVSVFSAHACSQDSETIVSENQDLTNSLNLRLQTMQIALGEVSNLKSDLELVESQRQSLESLSDDYNQMVKSLMKLEKDRSGSEEAIALCLRKMKDFENRLSSDILLPHQNSELRKMVFAKLVSENRDDWFATLSTYYPNEFQLTADQKRQMKKIKMLTTDKIAKAKLEFDKKLKGIRDDAKNEIRNVLTPKQAKILTELTGNARR